MSLVLLFHYLLLNMFRMLVHPSSGACDLFVMLFHVLYYSGSMCVGVTLWFGWGGVVSLCRLKHYSVCKFCSISSSQMALPVFLVLHYHNRNKQVNLKYEEKLFKLFEATDIVAVRGTALVNLKQLLICIYNKNI